MLKTLHVYLSDFTLFIKISAFRRLFQKKKINACLKSMLIKTIRK